MDYPEHEKLAAVRDKSQAVMEFVNEFLAGKGIFLARHGDESKGEDPDDIHYVYGSSDLAGEFFGIDRDKLEKEKQSMLDSCRNMAKPTRKEEA